MEQLTLSKKYNFKLFPIYKMISWDLLFYYAISFLFLTEAKGIDAATILFADSFYPIFKFLFQIPCTTLVDKIGKRKSLILANICVALYVYIMINATGTATLILSNVFCALGFITKSMCESNILYDSIPKTEKRGKIFSKIDGKASSYYYYLDAITSTITGVLFTFNPYLPMYICLAFCILSVFLAYNFKEIPKEKLFNDTSNNGKSILKNYLKDLKISFHHIFTSNRLRSLIIFNGIFVGIMSLLTTYRRSLLKDIGISPTYFGIIFAVWGILSGICASRQDWFHRKFRNRTLSYLSVPYTISCILIGLVAISNLPDAISIPFILFMFSFHYIAKGPFYTLIKTYFSNFSSSKTRTRIYSAKDFIESIMSWLFCLLGSFLLDITSTSYAMVIVGCIFTIMIIFSLEYMKTRIGLKPEQYSKKDIQLTELK